MKLTILTDFSLVIIALYLICLTHALVKTRRGEELLHIHYMTTPHHKNPCPGAWNLPFLCHHYYNSLFVWSMPEWREDDSLKNNAFLLCDLFGHALAQESLPCPGGHEIYNFGGPFLGHHYYNLNLPDLCLGVEKKIFKEIMYFHYMTYMATPSKRIPALGACNLQFWWTLPWSSLLLHLVCMVRAPEERRRFFKEIHQFLHFLPQNYLPFGWGGVMISPYPVDATYQIWLSLRLAL